MHSATPQAPTDTTSPYDDQIHVPPLTGTASQFDMRHLSTSSNRYRLEADTSALSKVDPGNWNAVIRQLAADPRWRVAEIDHAIVALRRVPDGEEWTTTRFGYIEQGGLVWRSLLRFTAWDIGLPWAQSESIVRVKSAKTVIDLSTFVLAEGTWRGATASALVVEGQDLSLEIYEAGPPDDRAVTAEQLSEVPAWVANLLARGAPGIDRDLLPPSEPKQGPPLLTLTSPGSGEIELRARINPGSGGWTWLRLVYGYQRCWDCDAVAIGTREALGYSDAFEEKFYWQARFPVAHGPAFPATAEVWFQPEDGEVGLTKIAEFDVVVPAR